MLCLHKCGLHILKNHQWEKENKKRKKGPKMEKVAQIDRRGKNKTSVVFGGPGSSKLPG